ncbi:MAG: zinc-binding dehydrogenase [Gemmatimonadales bacterium]
MIDVANEGKLTPLVDSVYPLDRGIEAYRRLAGGAHLGKVVIEVAP